jgi:hypothetical protein
MKINRTQLKQLMKEAIQDMTFDDLKRNINKYAEVDIDEPTEIDNDKTKRWYNKAGQLHRDNDLPAVIYADGSQIWYQNGKLHRDNDLPAVIWANGTQYWYKNDELHRDNDLPAIVFANGTQYWYQHGHLHRDNDKPVIILSNGIKYWYRNNELHRNNGKLAFAGVDVTKQRCENGKFIKRTQ